MEEFRTTLQDNPEETAGPISKLFFCFVNPFLRYGYKNKIDKEDLPRLLKEHEAEALTDAVEEAWERELMKSKKERRAPSLFRVIMKFYGFKHFFWGFIMFIQGIIMVATPVLVGGLIRYFREGSTMTQNTAYLYAAGVVLSAAFARIIHPPYCYNIMNIGMQLRVVFSTLIFRKAIRLSNSAMRRCTVGRIINLLSSDVGGFNFWLQYLNCLWTSPIHILIFLYLLHHYMGFASFAGMVLLCLLVPIQGFFSKLMGKYRRQISKRADERVGIMSEILNGIRVIKMYAWEGPFSELVYDARKREMKMIRKSALSCSVVLSLFFSSYHIVIAAAIVTWVLSGKPLEVERIYVSGALFISIRLIICHALPSAVQHYFQAKVTVEKVQEFLLLRDDAMEIQAKTKPDEKEQLFQKMVRDVMKGNDPANNIGVEMVNYHAKWDFDDQTSTLENINLSCKPGTLTLVIGPVGSGKSSLLSSILGEMIKDFGSMEVNGSIGYVPQEAWVFSASLRQNIFFGAEPDAHRYQATLRACALKKDLELMPEGDRTVVGDKGVALSGGQKARVNFARAVYRDADIYLMDDPLSAVDASVSKYLFKKCIMGHLKDKARILVTHQLQYLKYADNIIVLKDGRCVGSGTLEELKQQGDAFSSILQEMEMDKKKKEEEKTGKRSRHNSIEEEASETAEMIKETLKKGSSDDISESNWSLMLGTEKPVKQNAEESSTIGTVGWSVYYKYLAKSVVHPIFLIPLLLFFVFVQLLYNACDWWIKLWCTQSEYHAINSTRAATIFGHSLFDFHRYDFLTIYGIMAVLLLVFSLVRGFIFRNGLTNSARRLHNKMFRSVIESRILFFDKNPAGRILNRFSNDTGIMDEQLGNSFFDFFQNLLQFIFAVGLVCFLNPLLIFATVPMIFCFIFIRQYYIKTSRQVKRLESNARSPVLSHVAASLNGLITIRALKAEEAVLQNFYHYMDVHTSTFNIYYACTRWFGVCLDWFSILYIACVSFGNIAFPPEGMEAADMGLSLIYCILIVWLFQWLMHQSVEVETCMVSTERVIEYTQIEPERPLKTPKRKKPAKNWPNKGEIVMVDMKLKYAPDQPYILNGVTLRIRPAEKIGIVGRTGAGKSSLLKALFRTSFIEGTVKIDNVDTSEIGLRDLRSRLSIIPQDPVLFIGSLRKNLDPFDEYKDDEVWEALEQVQLKESVHQLADGLESSMQEGGLNFSVGQRQLICLARALLKKAKVLVIDEATANVDPHTDAVIQDKLRTCFVDSTVLCIAHRLNTIMDSNRVMVLSEGKVVEFDAPYVLLQNPNSIFKQLVNETGPDSVKLLTKIAEEAYRKYQPERKDAALDMVNDLFSKWGEAKKGVPNANNRELRDNGPIFAS